MHVISEAHKELAQSNFSSSQIRFISPQGQGTNLDHYSMFFHITITLRDQRDNAISLQGKRCLVQRQRQNCTFGKIGGKAPFHFKVGERTQKS